MKKIIMITILSTLALVLTACGASAGISQSSPANGSTAGNAGSANSSIAAPNDATPAGGLSALQLAAGMLKLDGTSNAVTAQEASQLLPLWQSLQQMENANSPQAASQGTPFACPNAAMMQQVGAQVVLIENAMSPAQIQAITAMNLSRQDIFAAFQQAGISMGGPGQGGGFRQNGGTFTPPQGTPRALGTPGAFQGGNFNGMRQVFGGFLPPSVVNGMVQFLQKKAAS